MLRTLQFFMLDPGDPARMATERRGLSAARGRPDGAQLWWRPGLAGRGGSRRVAADPLGL